MADEYDLVPVGQDPFDVHREQSAQTLPRTRVPLPSEADITPGERSGWQPPPPVSDPESLVWRDPVPGFGIRRGTTLDRLIPEDVSGRGYLERLRDNAGAVADKFRDTFERTADYAASRDPHSLLPHWLRSQLRPQWFNPTPVENLPPRYRDSFSGPRGEEDNVEEDDFAGFIGEGNPIERAARDAEFQRLRQLAPRHGIEPGLAELQTYYGGGNPFENIPVGPSSNQDSDRARALINSLMGRPQFSGRDALRGIRQLDQPMRGWSWSYEK